MKAVILCGGRGSRIRDVSEDIPKPMLPVGGKPILWHIMKIYAAHGVTEFVLTLGYKGWMIKEFFLNYQAMVSDVTLSFSRHNQIEFHNELQEARWKITLADTGEQTLTGGRIWKVRRYLEDADHFCLTYGDGVADISISDLIAHHKQSGLAATLTAGKYGGRFGELQWKDGKVTTFKEKPADSGDRINGGFMMLDGQRIWDYFEPRDDLVLETDVLYKIMMDGQLGYYRHDGFWQCMDTPREYEQLNALWNRGSPPWKIW